MFFSSLRDVPIASCDDVAADKIDLHDVDSVTGASLYVTLSVSIAYVRTCPHLTLLSTLFRSSSFQSPHCLHFPIGIPICTRSLILGSMGYPLTVPLTVTPPSLLRNRHHLPQHHW